MIFDKIIHFAEYHKNCPLCGQETILYLRAGHHAAYDKFKIINGFDARLTDGQFVFKIDYTSPYISFHGDCKIDASTNFFTFSTEMEPSSIEVVIEVFENYHARLEAACHNKSCQYKYYVLSRLLRLWQYPIGTAELGNTVVRPTSCDVEFLNITPKFCAMTDLNMQKTYIYNTESMDDSIPIQIPQVKFDPQNKDKQINRILTIVNFG